LFGPFFIARTIPRILPLFEGRARRALDTVISTPGEMKRDAFEEYVLKAPLEELFELKEPSFEAPPEAQIFQNIVCDKCREPVSEHKIRFREGKKLCRDCFEDYSRAW
jgi:formylmethanofuran dehydrogenase subunit E